MTAETSFAITYVMVDVDIIVHYADISFYGLFNYTQLFGNTTVSFQRQLAVLMFENFRYVPGAVLQLDVAANLV